MRTKIGWKSVQQVHPAHDKQRLTHLRLTGIKLGYLLHFGEALMKDRVIPTIHGEFSSCLGVSVAL
jgi:hypothetical protein